MKSRESYIPILCFDKTKLEERWLTVPQQSTLLAIGQVEEDTGRSGITWLAIAALQNVGNDSREKSKNV